MATPHTQGAPRSAYADRDDYIIVTRSAVRALGSWEAAGLFQRIAYRSERKGYWTATIAEIAEEVGLSHFKARRAADTLREHGWIESSREHPRDSTLQWSVVWEDARPGSCIPHPVKRPATSGGAVYRTTPCTKTEKKKEESTHDADASNALCDHFADLLETNGRKRPRVTAAWLKAAQSLIDEHGADTVRSLLDWTQADGWWRSRTVTPMRLASHWDTLRQQSTEPRRNIGQVGRDPIVAAEQAARHKYAAGGELW